MALLEFTNLNKHCNLRTRIIHSKGAFGVNPKGLGSFIHVNTFKYEYNHPVLPPNLFVLNGKKYLMPYWREVDINTEISDVFWNRPVKKQTEVINHKFLSSKGDVTYNTKETIFPNGEVKYSCNCPGHYRAFDRRCKHIKELEKNV
jgi:hypothetical protein